jgi:hypothetical protein
MRHASVAATLVAVLLAGCSGGSGSSPVVTNPGTPGSSGGSSLSPSDVAVSTVNAVGSPLKDFAAYNATLGPTVQSEATRTLSVTNVSSPSGACSNGVEFFAPDKNGDAHSTETQVFYDAACTQLARDTVRIVTPTGSSSETVARTESLYAPNNATPIATRTATETLTNATFDANGFPLVANGFDRTDMSALSIAGSKTIDSDGELVMLPATGGGNAFCGDSAGFNATGFAKLGETFGWQGVRSNGMRVVNGDGSVTWTSTHAGTTFKGAIGSLSIGVGSANTTCPIATPAFTLAGGTSTGTFSIPVSATYLHSVLVSLTIANATLANGNTLNVTTNPSAGPASNQYVTGVVSNASGQVATFGVDAFGDGTLTVTSTGAQFVITDWHVVR